MLSMELLTNQKVFYFVTVLLVGLSWFSMINGELLVGDTCTLKNTGASGVCKLLLDCPKAVNDARYDEIPPTVCGYQNLQRIVCCVIAKLDDRVETENSPVSNMLRFRKCKIYAQSVNEPKCYVADPLIIGGSPAQSREFPHSALLGYYDSNNDVKWGCGGSLVSSRYVLTAGHCLDSRGLGEVAVVRLGELNIDSNTDDATPIDIRVELIIPHPNYTISMRYNDIALIKLAQQTEFSSYIKPICLPSKAVVPIKSIATGWGVVDWLGTSSNTLLKVYLESFSYDECNNIYQFNADRKLKNGIISTQLCAGSRDHVRDTCQGDSGGPLQIYHPSVDCMYIQTGITSFGIGCGSVNIPGVYTKVYDYSNWIESVIWAPGEDE